MDRGRFIFVLSGFLITGILYDSRTTRITIEFSMPVEQFVYSHFYYAFLALFCGIVPMALGFFIIRGCA